jgi:hypothetical protein
MARGRKRKPIALHLLRGTFRADRHGPRPPAGPPESGSALGPAPEYLRGRARALWGELARIAPWLEGPDRWKAGMWCALQAELEGSRGGMRTSRLTQLRLLAKDLNMGGQLPGGSR